jgi:hypothetical protein
MTEPDRKFEEELRRALCAASDLVVPAGDGLNKIRERAARRPPALGWLLASVARLPRQLVRGGRVAASEVAATTHGYSSLGLVIASARRWPGQARHVLRTPGVWLRPLLAGATALLLVISVTLSIPRLRQQVTAQLDSAFGSSSGQGSNGGGADGAGAGGAQSSSATPLPSWTATHMLGKPFLATMPPGSTQCRDQGSSGTVAARTNAGAADLAGAVGPQPVSVTCSATPAPTKQATSPPVSPPVTTAPVTTPPVVATTPPVTTSPPTTPPTTTSPPTTPPTTTSPPTTPPTSPPTQTSTSSTNNPPAAGVPTETPAPGG